jgi:hypothetical protein
VKTRWEHTYKHLAVAESAFNQELLFISHIYNLNMNLLATSLSSDFRSNTASIHGLV